MMSGIAASPSRTPRRAQGAGAWALAACVALVSIGLLVTAPAARAADTPPLWSQLSANEQKALQPLEGLWSTIGTDRKQKWREVASRFPSMSVDEQQRIRERMVDWAKMSPAERGAARLGFEQTKAVPLSERQAGWDAYRALPEEQRKALASQASAAKPKAGATPPVALAADPGRPAQAPSTAKVPATGAAGATGAIQSKSNIVATTPVQARPVAPAIVQATVGASTRPINQRPVPPAHNQPGQPKIAATPEFVDRATLLPQRPSSAATPSAAPQTQQP